ncbi:MAG: methyltransferase family protein [Stenotrophobium sp.]
MEMPPQTPRPRLQALDLIEKILLLALYAAFLIRMLSKIDFAHLLLGLALALPLLAGEGLVLVFGLIRKKTEIISIRPRDWFLALTATCLPLLVAPEPQGQGWLPAPIFVACMLLALGFQIYSKIVLGRSFGLVAANRGLKLHGPYLWVRHPIYAGYLLMHLTYLLGNPTGRNLLIYVLFYCLQLPRIAAEERLLVQNPQYREYLKTVKYRLIPGIY